MTKGYSTLLSGSYDNNEFLGLVNDPVVIIYKFH